VILYVRTICDYWRIELTVCRENLPLWSYHQIERVFQAFFPVHLKTRPTPSFSSQPCSCQNIADEFETTMSPANFLRVPAPRSYADMVPESTFPDSNFSHPVPDADSIIDVFARRHNRLSKQLPESDLVSQEDLACLKEFMLRGVLCERCYCSAGALCTDVPVRR
jgi:hypothetical protein